MGERFTRVMSACSLASHWVMNTSSKAFSAGAGAISRTASRGFATLSAFFDHITPALSDEEMLAKKVDIVLRQEEKFAITISALEAMIKRGAYVEEDQKLALYEAYAELGYVDLQQPSRGRKIPAPSGGEYVLDKYFFYDRCDGKEHLVAYFFKKKDGQDPPLIIIRGTDRHDPNLRYAHGKADFSSCIGKELFETDKEDMIAWLKENPGAVVVGHSLGGVLAERLVHESLVRKCPTVISAVYTYCSPGVEKGLADSFAKEVALLGSECPKIIHVRHTNDYIPRCAKLLQGVVFELKGAPFKEAHTKLVLSEAFLNGEAVKAQRYAILGNGSTTALEEHIIFATEEKAKLASDDQKGVAQESTIIKIINFIKLIFTKIAELFSYYLSKLDILDHLRRGIGVVVRPFCAACSERTDIYVEMH